MHVHVHTDNCFPTWQFPLLQYTGRDLQRQVFAIGCHCKQLQATRPLYHDSLYLYLCVWELRGVGGPMVSCIRCLDMYRGYVLLGGVNDS